MLKKLFFIFLVTFFLNSCGYTPLYINNQNLNYNFNIENVEGDTDINRLIIKQIKNNSKNTSKDIVNISLNSIFQKKIIAKDSSGNSSDYRLEIDTTFVIKKGNNKKEIFFNEYFMVKKNNDFFEQKNYEDSIKENMVSMIIDQLLIEVINFE